MNSELIKEYVCKYCSNIFNDPIICIGCSEWLCRKDIKINLENQSYAEICPGCNVSSTFIPNEMAQNVLNKLWKDVNDNHADFVELIEIYKQKIINIEKLIKEPENAIYEKFYELRSKIDLDREKAISEINKTADHMISRLDEEENKLKYQTRDNLKDYNSYLSEIKKEFEFYENYLKTFEIFCDMKKEERSKNIEIELTKIEDLSKEIEKTLFGNKSFNYKSMNIKQSLNEFGKLKISINK